MNADLFDPIEVADPASPTSRVECALVRAEFGQRTQWVMAASTFRAIDDVLREAEAHPEVYVDQELFDLGLVRGDAIELSVRAAVMDLATRLRMSEGTVRNQGHIAAILRGQMPGLWAAFLDGEVPTGSAREAARLAEELPASLWAVFEQTLLEPAMTLNPARFIAKAKAVRERLDPAPLLDRHGTAMKNRRIWSEVDRDGMSFLGAYVPSEAAALATARIDEAAFALFIQEDETRTMPQIRADVLCDLLTGTGTGTGTGTSAPASPSVAVGLTIPLLTMLGNSDEPAILEGVGPIDIETAKRLTERATSFTRILTDPITDEVLHVDPNLYRITKSMRRSVAIRQPTCSAPGCGRRAVDADLDHITAWADGGRTTLKNLHPLCRKHHTIKHNTRWQVDRVRVDTVPGAHRTRWTSPTGHTSYTDPPPF